MSSEAEGHFDPRWLGTSIPIDHWHFHRQLLHRYRIVLAPGDFSAIVAAIRDGRARLIERQANGRVVYSVRVPSVGDRVFVLVSGARNVVTVLRPTRRLKGMRRAIELSIVSPEFAGICVPGIWNLRNLGTKSDFAFGHLMHFNELQCPAIPAMP